MKKEFSSAWKASSKPSKQRKFAAKSPKHIASKAVASHLSPEMRKKHGKRSVTIRKGDKVKVVRGQFSKKEGKVESVDTRRKKVMITGIEFLKKDGSKALYPISPSNIMITELNAEDKRRIKDIGGKNGKETPQKA